MDLFMYGVGVFANTGNPIVGVVTGYKNKDNAVAKNIFYVPVKSPIDLDNGAADKIKAMNRFDRVDFLSKVHSGEDVVGFVYHGQTYSSTIRDPEREQNVQSVIKRGFRPEDYRVRVDLSSGQRRKLASISRNEAGFLLGNVEGGEAVAETYIPVPSDYCVGLEPWEMDFKRFAQSLTTDIARRAMFDIYDGDNVVGVMWHTEHGTGWNRDAKEDKEIEDIIRSIIMPQVS